MQKTAVQLSEIKLIGITCRTNNAAEVDPHIAKIGAVVQKYMQQTIAKNIKSRKNPGVTFSVYTNYETDFMGNYTYFIGEEVTSLDSIPDGFESLVISAQNYVKFTSDLGAIPDVCINMWKKIWQMDESALGGERAYIADSEVYDERATDRQNTILDIYIGVSK